MVCAQPFTAIEIDTLGDVYTCCPSFVNFYKIGNIWENSPDEIWTGEKITELRRRVLNEDYSLCNLDLCRQRQSLNIKQIDLSNVLLPQYITLAYDKECNLKCITCRDEKYQNSTEQIELYNNKIDKLLLPLIKEAKIIALSGSGEALYSRHSRLLIKKLAQINKHIMFNINTNGILFNKRNCEELGIYGRINEVFISLPAIDRKIYNEIMIGSNYDVVIENTKMAAIDKNFGKITLNMVVSVLNYKEIPLVAEFAKSNNIWLTVSQFCHWGTKFGKDYKEVAVWDESHKDFNKFQNILKSPVLNYEKIFMSPLFKRIQKGE